jgi:hypothetical protein
MAIYFSTPVKNGMIDDLVIKIAGTSGTAGTATLRIYTGTQPTGGSAGTGVLLCTISNIGWTSATNGSAGMAEPSGYLGTAVSDGTAGWARIANGGTDGTMYFDGPLQVGVGTQGIGLNDLVLVADTEVEVVYFGMKIS